MNYNLLHSFQLKLISNNAVILAFSLSWFLFGATSNLTLAQTRDKGAAAKTTPNQKPSLKSPVKTVSNIKDLPKAAKLSSPKSFSEQILIVAGFNVYVRENPLASAENRGQLKLGTIVSATQRSKSQEVIGDRKDFWYKITLTKSGKSGWVFGAFLKNFDQNKREIIYKQITTEKFKADNRSFGENAELYDFLTRAQSEVKTPALVAEIGLWRLLSLKSALGSIPIDKIERSPYKEFTDFNLINIVYDEPGGQWLVRSDRFWSLSERFANLPIGEKIAWEAAQNPLPGECEGYLNCYLFAARQTHGEYLNRFAKGAHAAEALKSIGSFLQEVAADADKKEVYNAPADISDRAEFYKNIAELRSIISRTGFFEKETILSQLDKIGESYR